MKNAVQLICYVDRLGGTLPGLPFVVLGRNDHVAWTMTTTNSDTQDLFVEKVAPGGQAFVDGAYCDAESGRTYPCTSPVSGETIARFGAKSIVPSRSQPRPNGSEMSVMMNWPWMTNSEK